MTTRSIRYRGYYWDWESGFYYCMSRYYNPEWCRWISADVFFDTQDGIMGTNLYTYCLNDPINLCDPSGTFGDPIHNGKGDKKTGIGYGTYFWAYQFFRLVDIDHEVAKLYAQTFADANVSVDSRATSSTYKWYNPDMVGKHFNNSRDLIDSRESNYLTHLARAEDAAKYNSDIFGVLEELGKGLHSLQDQVSHNGDWGDIAIFPFGPNVPYSIHFQGGWAIDDFVVGDAKYRGALLATVRALRDFARLSNKYNLLQQTIPLSSW